MKRVGFQFKIRQDRLEEYKAHHKHDWPEMLNALHEAGWHNYTLFLRQGGNTQTGYVLALHFDLLPPKLRPMAAAKRVEDIRQRDHHLSTGIVGTPYLNEVQTEMGYMDTAYTLLKQTPRPSRLYSDTQGATTIWERWDGWTHEASKTPA